ncbi:phosphodiester glycosidase family protein [Flavobacterium branchiicola]|uniref:Phosphodiester glycosidase family protein n=1 Tax=Flavobacterium branchiicola TaxID=1114875 RepID=A0ABV9PC56_9FLAO|nr:phosphodiester glycosidase family protein [Flavobacterium branchiicola]MBS7253085.1 phosphodiester glycosidase family protein [Flavobacterium branchiicola]
MKIKLFLFLFIAGLSIIFVSAEKYPEDLFLTYKVDVKKQDLKLVWKDEKGKRFGSIENLKFWAAKKNLTVDFAMNAGMYKTDHSPQGLYIENQKQLISLDTTNAEGNFYLKPNGVFFITTKKVAVICRTEMFKNNKEIEFATQSGPMLVIDGQIHSTFKEGAKNVNIRNGVGVLPNGNVVFVLSKKEVNFYDFANYFKSLGCKNALYLDGFVSRAYLPSQNWFQLDGDFGALFAITKKN